MKVKDQELTFHEPETYQQLVEGASKVDPRAHIVVLLGGDAGLRRGEIIGLNQTDVDSRRKQITVRRRVYRGKEGPPKGGKSRVIPMTDALAAALKQHRHLRGERILYGDDGLETTPKILRPCIEKAERRAGLPVTGGIHILRHTFCSRLAMRNAPVRTIQELAGHKNLSTTLRYMHLSQGAKHDAIRLLDEAHAASKSELARGDIVETANGDRRFSNDSR